MKLINHSCVLTGLAVASITLSAGAATETAPAMQFSMSIGSNQSSWTDVFGASAGGTLWSYNSSHLMQGGGMHYALEVDPDPILGFDFSFFNDTLQTQTFFVMVSLPVTPFAGATKIGASIGGSVTDANFDGIGNLKTTAGQSSIFKGWIDGAEWMTLFDAPYDVFVPYTGATEILGPDVDGLPGPSIDGPGLVSNSMSVTLMFDLSAGDRASFTGVFIVEYVPTPAGALALLGLGLLRRRRR